MTDMALFQTDALGLTPDIAPIARPSGVDRPFAEALDRAVERRSDRASPPPASAQAPINGPVNGSGEPDEAREAAEQLIAVTFIQPILREIRESNNAPPPFAPTAVEKQFGPMLDAQLADRLVRASGWDIIDRVERDMRAGGTPRHGAGDVAGDPMGDPADPKPFPGLTGRHLNLGDPS